MKSLSESETWAQFDESLKNAASLPCGKLRQQKMVA